MIEKAPYTQIPDEAFNKLKDLTSIGLLAYICYKQNVSIPEMMDKFNIDWDTAKKTADELTNMGFIVKEKSIEDSE